MTNKLNLLVVKLMVKYCMILGDKNTPVCGMGRISCYIQAKLMLLFHSVIDNDLVRKHIKACNCLPSCTSIDYNPVIDRVKFDKAAIGLTSKRNANVSG